MAELPGAILPEFVELWGLLQEHLFSLQSLANVVHIRGLLELVLSQREHDADAILALHVVKKVG